MHYNTIIVGAGIAGLYYAHKLVQNNTDFIILEKNKKKYIGGRIGYDYLDGVRISSGAGIGRYEKDKILLNLLNELQIKYNTFDSNRTYPSTFNKINIEKTVKYIKSEYKKNPVNTSFKLFASSIIGKSNYDIFVKTIGYNDFDNQDVNDALQHYGFDDYYDKQHKLFTFDWKLFLDKMIKGLPIKTNHNVIKIKRDDVYTIKCANDKIFTCDNLVMATTITHFLQACPFLNYKNNPYQYIKGTPFLRIYAKFSERSIEVAKQYLSHMVVPNDVQQIIPINVDKGVYMIVYNSGKSAIKLKKYMNDKKYICKLIEKSLNIPSDSLHIKKIKSYYWNIGTHYFEPLSNNYKNRDEFIKVAQQPYKNMIVVGEMVSRFQGWVNGALHSVESVI